MLILAPNLKLPDDAITQTFALLGRRGSGKTHAASVLAEEFLKTGFPIVWLDPLGVAWGLRSGYPIIILGGDHADVPLQSTRGATVADFVVQQRVPTILDVSAFGENEMRRFVAEFADRLYRTNRDPLHVFLDEADEFAPQSASGGALAKCLGAIQNIVRRGRARGLGVTLITQRSAVLSKSVLTQTECLIAMQTTAPHDQQAIEAWLKYHGTPAERDEIMRSLPKLQQGEAWVYSPAWLQVLKRVKIRQRTTHDSSSTPKPGQRQRQPKRLKKVDLAALREQMQAAIDEAEAADPKVLRKRIVELEKKLSVAQSATPAAKVERVEMPVLKARDVERLVKALEAGETQIERYLKRFHDAATYAADVLGQVRRPMTNDQGTAGETSACASPDDAPTRPPDTRRGEDRQG